MPQLFWSSNKIIADSNTTRGRTVFLVVCRYYWSFGTQHALWNPTLKKSKIVSKLPKTYSYHNILSLSLLLILKNVSSLYSSANSREVEQLCTGNCLQHNSPLSSFGNITVWQRANGVSLPSHKSRGLRKDFTTVSKYKIEASISVNDQITIKIIFFND